jgi:transposase InsO family protein
VRFTFIQMEKAVYSLCILCRVMQVSRSGYYKWLGRTRSARAIRDAELTTKIRAIHNHSRQTYGSPRIHAELREEGTPISRKRVARIMRQESIAGVPRKRYRHTTDSNHKYAIASNLLNRTFDVKTPNTVWSCDITHVWTWEGWIYLAVVMDLFSRRVVGWAAAHHMRTELVLNAFDMAVARRSPADGIIHHSDRGSQYASSVYQRALTRYGMVCSMSRKGDCPG